jgi:hypothetical protein
MGMRSRSKEVVVASLASTARGGGGGYSSDVAYFGLLFRPSETILIIFILKINVIKQIIFRKI